MRLTLDEARRIEAESRRRRGLEPLAPPAPPRPRPRGRAAQPLDPEAESLEARRRQRDDDVRGGAGAWDR